MSRHDVCTEIAARIATLLAQGVAPWRRDWSEGRGMPSNAATGKRYRGLNVLALLVAQLEGGYGSSRWLTFQQAKALGGHVRRGEKGTQIAFWRRLEVRDRSTHEGEAERSKVIPLARAYTVFNIEQCEGLELPVEPARPEPIAAAEQLVAGYLAKGPSLVHGGDPAYFPTLDLVRMPELDCFDTASGYYTALFHELGHSTGHTSRLGRPLVGFGSGEVHTYSQEELVAEFTSAMLCGLAGIANDDNLENAAAYLKHWSQKIVDEPRCLIRAASQAQAAVDWIVGAGEADEAEHAEAA